RTVTVHQLEALISEGVSEALTTYASRVLVASGFLNNLYDEDVELREVWRIFRKATAHLRALADSGALVLVVCPNPGARGEPGRTMRLRDRDGMLDALMAEADKVIRLETSTLYLEKSVRATDAFSRSGTRARSIRRR
ncbi:MAG: Rad51 protein, partial [candidate division NC10 bacterium]|nr:Rad51 protein [candidate division NC10 bacterium]